MIIVNLDVELAKKKMKLGKLAKDIRFLTLDTICQELDCQPGDILEYRLDK